MAALGLQRHHCVNGTKCMWLIKPKMFSIFHRKFADTWIIGYALKCQALDSKVVWDHNVLIFFFRKHGLYAFFLVQYACEK